MQKQWPHGKRNFVFNEPQQYVLDKLTKSFLLGQASFQEVVKHRKEGSLWPT